jgi:hypothetical protein
VASTRAVSARLSLSPGTPFRRTLYEHDVDRANELLDELGLVDADGDGMRDLPDGSPFRPELLDSNRFSAKTPELMKEHLREVGIDLQLNILEQAAADEAAVQANYPMALVGFGGIMGDPDTLRTRYASDAPGGSFNRTHGYSNPEVDRLAKEQLVAVDRGERMALVAQMQQIIAEDCPRSRCTCPTTRSSSTGRCWTAGTTRRAAAPAAAPATSTCPSPARRPGSDVEDGRGCSATTSPTTRRVPGVSSATCRKPSPPTGPSPGVRTRCCSPSSMVSGGRPAGRRCPRCSSSWGWPRPQSDLD